MDTAVILFQCPDQKGIVAKLSDFVFRHEGNIVDSDQYTTDPEGGRFFMRIAFSFDDQVLEKGRFETELGALANTMEGTCAVHYASTVMRMGVLCSKQDHCLVDVLYRHRTGEFPVEIPLVISNHPDVQTLVEHYGIPFHHVPISKETKLDKELEILNLVRDTTDFLVLARYMQILTDGFLAAYKKDLINIHHSFLPSFKGANPYKQAYDRGVKVIGATAHFVTPELDEGPIIEQVVERVSHKDRTDDLKRKGKNLEKIALANAIRVYIEHRIIRYQNKTIVFE